MTQSEATDGTDDWSTDGTLRTDRNSASQFDKEEEQALRNEEEQESLYDADKHKYDFETLLDTPDLEDLAEEFTGNKNWNFL